VASEASFTFTTDRAGVDRLLHDPNGPMGQWLTRLGNSVVNGAKPRANVDTGLMRSRIEFRLETEGGQLVGYVAARTNYSFFVIERTGNNFLLDALREALG
jgi:hypothetical protein